MKSYVFPVVIEKDRFEDGREAYSADCPSLPGCHSWGHTYHEALANIREAVELYIAALREKGEPIPVDPQHGALELLTPAIAVNV
jgi:predicted RNase H-like HicB family nuclease